MPLIEALRAPPGPVTPAWVRASWTTLRPFSGRSPTCSRVRLVLSSALTVFISDCASAAETSTVSVTPPTATTTSMDVGALRTTRTSSITVVLKPGAAAATR